MRRRCCLRIAPICLALATWLALGCTRETVERNTEQKLAEPKSAMVGKELDALELIVRAIASDYADTLADDPIGLRVENRSVPEEFFGRFGGGKLRVQRLDNLRYERLAVRMDPIEFTTDPRPQLSAAVFVDDAVTPRYYIAQWRGDRWDVESERSRVTCYVE